MNTCSTSNWERCDRVLRRSQSTHLVHKQASLGSGRRASWASRAQSSRQYRYMSREIRFASSHLAECGSKVARKLSCCLHQRKWAYEVSREAISIHWWSKAALLTQIVLARPMSTSIGVNVFESSGSRMSRGTNTGRPWREGLASQDRFLSKRA